MYRLIEGSTFDMDAELAAAANVEKTGSTVPQMTPPDGGETAEAEQTPSHEETFAPVRRKPEVPEYLRTSKRGRFWPAAVTLVVAALVTGGVLLSPEYMGNLVQRLFGVGEEPDLGGDGRPLAKGRAEETKQKLGDDASRRLRPGLKSPTEGTAPQPDEGPGDSLPPAPVPKEPVQRKIQPDVPPKAVGGEPKVVRVSPDLKPTPDVLKAADPKKPEARAKVVEEDATAAKKPAAKKPAADEALPVEPDAVEPVTVGRLLSKDQVLLRLDRKSKRWQRVPVTAERPARLNVGDSLLVLPTFRPMLGIAAVTIEVDGGSLVEIGAIDEEGVPRIEVHFGRIVARPLGLADAKIRLKCGAHEGLVSFGDADSTFAAEVRPFRTPGTDPMEVPSQVAVDLYAASGRIGWLEGDQTASIEAANVHTLSPHPRGPSGPAGRLPKWVSSTQMTVLEGRASPVVSDRVRTDRSVKLSLVELTDHRRSEVRSLAIRCCAYIGHFEPVVATLTDAEHARRPDWGPFVRELFDGVARDAESAEKIKAILDQTHGEEADKLNRMLQGYSNQGLAGGDAKQLVDDLDSKHLPFRVLASWNLEHITGARLSFDPSDNDVRRRPSLSRWKRKLALGEIKFPSPVAAKTKE